MDGVKKDRHPIFGIEDGEEVIYTPRRLVENSRNLKGSANSVYLVLAYECGKNKSYETELTDNKLADICNTSKSTLRRSLDALEKYGFIERQRGWNKRKIILKDY
jgi:DNA-binding MarR family transcriptional regulator